MYILTCTFTDTITVAPVVSSSLPVVSSSVPVVTASVPAIIDVTGSKLSYETRAGLCKNATARALFQNMARKQTNLCVAVDKTTMAEVCLMCPDLGWVFGDMHICVKDITD